MKDKIKEKLEKKVRELLEDDFDLFDFNAYYDSNLTYNENYNLIIPQVKHLVNKMPKYKKDCEGIPKKQYKEMVNNAYEEYKVNCQKQFREELDKILSKSDSKELEKQYFKPKSYIEMVIKNHIKGLILFGEGGLGKSYLTLKTLKDNNLKVYDDYAYLKGYMTTLELYHFLYENRNKLIILDDINILDNENNLNLLKGCLDDNNRWVSYSTTSEKLKAPNQFLFNGKMILLLNCKPSTNPSLRAVETRVFNYEVGFDFKTKIKLMHELSKKEYKGLSKEKRFEIVRFIKKNTSEGTINLNFRLLFQLYECYLYDKNNFEELAKGILKDDEDLNLLRDLLDKNNEVKNACREWMQITGKSRATFFRFKKRLRL